MSPPRICRGGFWYYGILAPYRPSYHLHTLTSSNRYKEVGFRTHLPGKQPRV